MSLLCYVCHVRNIDVCLLVDVGDVGKRLPSHRKQQGLLISFRTGGGQRDTATKLYNNLRKAQLLLL